MAAGVIKEISNEDRCYYTAKDIMELLGVSRDKAYRMIRDLKKELEAQGLLFRGFKEGTIPKWIFRKAYMLDEVEVPNFVINFNNKQNEKK